MREMRPEMLQGLCIVFLPLPGKTTSNHRINSTIVRDNGLWWWSHVVRDNGFRRLSCKLLNLLRFFSYRPPGWDAPVSATDWGGATAASLSCEPCHMYGT